MVDFAGGLWAITSYFNPLGYRRRLANFHRFRAALDLPLAVAELGFDGQWDLNRGDAELYLRIGDGDLMWQKERLLNLIVAHLPAECTHVAWIDCDLVAERGWAPPLVDALAAAPLVQAYRHVQYLGPDGAVERSASSAVARIEQGSAPTKVLGGVTNRTGGAATPGMAWAARRDLIARYGLYDRCIIGGGDTALASAAYGCFDAVIALHRMNARQQRRYLAWAQPFHAAVQGGVGVAELEIQHLWHGALADRQAGVRHRQLMEHDFDPDSDIAPGRDGAWRWASNKPQLHQLLADYFRARREDEATSPAQ